MARKGIATYTFPSLNDLDYHLHKVLDKMETAKRSDERFKAFKLAVKMDKQLKSRRKEVTLEPSEMDYLRRIMRTDPIDENVILMFDRITEERF